jgi:hypothetical protein
LKDAEKHKHTVALQKMQCYCSKFKTFISWQSVKDFLTPIGQNAVSIFPEHLLWARFCSATQRDYVLDQALQYPSKAAH